MCEYCLELVGGWDVRAIHVVIITTVNLNFLITALLLLKVLTTVEPG
jgi:hypothetical protein